MRRPRFGVPWLCVLLTALLAAPITAEDETQSADAEDQQAEGAPEASTEWPAEWVTAIAPLGDGSQMVAATAQGLLFREAAVVQCEGADLESAQTLYTHPVSVWAVIANDRTIASSDYKGNLAIYDRESGQVTMHEGVLERWTRCLRFAPDGDQIIAGNETGSLMVWSPEKQAITARLEVDAQQLYDIAFAPAGDRLAVADGGGHVHLVSWPGLENQRTLELSEQALWTVHFSPDGGSVIAGGADQKLWRVGLEDGAEPVTLATAKDWISASVMDASSGGLVVLTISGQVLAWQPGSEDFTSIASLPSGAWSLAQPNPGTIYVATRKHRIASLGRAWTIQYIQESESDE